MQLELDKIRADGGTQPRASVDIVVIAEYAADMTDGAKFPPVTVFDDGSDHWLADGFHRYEAAKIVDGCRSIGADVRQGTVEDAKWFAYGANKSHGLRRSNEDKARAVVAALKHPSGTTLSDSQIARHVGVSVTTVGKYRVELETAFQIGKVTERRGSDGKTYRISNIGQQQHTQSLLVVEHNGDLQNGVATCDQCGQLYDGTGIDHCPYCAYTQEQRIDYLRGSNGLPHVSRNTGNNEWYTPAEYIEAARGVMGTIDLDPASSTEANTVVKAERFFDIEANGLEQEWRGRIWLNPPYSSDWIGDFAAKLTSQFQIGNIAEAVVLVNNATETSWFQKIAAISKAVCFPSKRVRFWAPDGKAGAPLQGQAVLYIGRRPERFTKEFRPFGLVLYA